MNILKSRYFFPLFSGLKKGYGWTRMNIASRLMGLNGLSRKMAFVAENLYNVRSLPITQNV